MRLGYLLTIAAALALLLPAGSSAQGGSLPSDGSALEQYVESVPDGKGGRPSQDVSAGGGGGSSSAAPIGGGLQTLGADGDAAARLASVTAPGVGVGGSGDGEASGGADPSDSGGAAGSQGSGGSGSSGGGLAVTLADPGDSGDTASDAIGSLLGSESGLGDALPVILLAVLLVALAAAAVRSRRPGRGEKTP